MTAKIFFFSVKKKHLFEAKLHKIMFFREYILIYFSSYVSSICNCFVFLKYHRFNNLTKTYLLISLIGLIFLLKKKRFLESYDCI